MRKNSSTHLTTQTKRIDFYFGFPCNFSLISAFFLGAQHLDEQFRQPVERQAHHVVVAPRNSRHHAASSPLDSVRAGLVHGLPRGNVLGGKGREFSRMKFELLRWNSDCAAVQGRALWQPRQRCVAGQSEESECVRRFVCELATGTVAQNDKDFQQVIKHLKQLNTLPPITTEYQV